MAGFGVGDAWLGWLVAVGLAIGLAPALVAAEEALADASAPEAPGADESSDAGGEPDA